MSGLSSSSLPRTLLVASHAMLAVVAVASLAAGPARAQAADPTCNEDVNNNGTLNAGEDLDGDNVLDLGATLNPGVACANAAATSRC